MAVSILARRLRKGLIGIHLVELIAIFHQIHRRLARNAHQVPNLHRTGGRATVDHQRGYSVPRAQSLLTLAAETAFDEPDGVRQKPL